ncbi:hypothetical protein RP20_CCG011748 [Aedes albopictus]|nr:hypothetical protein RP20_CCG011748 [Aedes albopictus]
MASAQALRALDIRTCVQCCACLERPCGELGRGLAVSCGVCLNNSRKCYCGCIPQLFNCCLRLCGSAAEVVIVVLGILLIGVIAVWLLYMNVVSSKLETDVDKVPANVTLNYGDVGWIDLDDRNSTLNTTVGDYDVVSNQTDFAVEHTGNYSDVTWLMNGTASFSDTTKQYVEDNIDRIEKHQDTVEATSGP